MPGHSPPLPDFIVRLGKKGWRTALASGRRCLETLPVVPTAGHRAPPAADLPGASKELQEVSQLLPGCQLSRGDQATLKVLFQPGQRWGLLHFASHAHYRPDQPTESDIQLHDGLLQLKQLPQLAMAEHTLWR